jgi:alpha-N-arabinofuranosidase
MNKKSFLLVCTLIVFLLPLVLSAEASIKINTEKKGEPISKYIYGQFIEHLGKCIYGGLWAEMLLDRKFYYEITDKFYPWTYRNEPFWDTDYYRCLSASPWQVVGPVGTVTMDSDNPYTGKHSPVIHGNKSNEKTGIKQSWLTLKKGQKYTGRIILAGEKKAAPVTVQLVLKNGKTLSKKIKNISSEYKEYPLEFVTPASCGDYGDVSIEIFTEKEGNFKIGTISLMPADNIKGWKKDVVSLLKELNAPVYRWPGGNFVSGYNWRDGIGEPRDKRPPRKNPAWQGVESNDVGIHEYMELMELIDAEPFVAVNTGLGTIEEVAEEVEYCNGSKDTPMGKLRAKNGHPEPYNVKWWAIGNEMYGSWQLGHMPIEKYTKKHNDVVKAMRKVDNNIKPIAVGEVGEWSKEMLENSSDYMSLISEHIYVKEKVNIPEHTAQLADAIRGKADAHRKYRKEIKGLEEKDIDIAMDEWNYWYGDYIYGELGVRYYMRDALGVARAFHEYYRNSDIIFMANYAQTVNVIGAIKTNDTTSTFAATGMVLKLYRNNFGSIPVEISGKTGDLDIFAALTKNEDSITISIVNPTGSGQKLNINLPEVGKKSQMIKWEIQHPNPAAYNEPGKKPEVDITEENVNIDLNKLSIKKYSIVLFKIPLSGKTKDVKEEEKDFFTD